MPGVRLYTAHDSIDIDVGLPFSSTIDFIAEMADIGCYVRIAIAPDVPYGEEEQYTVLWTRDFPIPKSRYPRWLQEELAKLKRSSKRRHDRHAYCSALLLGLYTMKSSLGKEEKFRYLQSQDLKSLPQTYPTQETWDRTAWVPYDPEFLAELAEKQHLDPQYRWLAPALRRAGDRVQWLCGCQAAFVSQEEHDILKAEPRTKKCPYPESVQLLHPTEGTIYVYVLPMGRVSTVEFVDRAFECSGWDRESA